jgi:cobalt-zinc-cadmium resistance protein CzcA
LHAGGFYSDVVRRVVGESIFAWGLAISIGMMVDATVVMVENIYRHLEEHYEKSVREAILVAAQEIGRPIFFAILVIIAGVFAGLYAAGKSRGSCLNHLLTRSPSRWSVRK